MSIFIYFLPFLCVSMGINNEQIVSLQKIVTANISKSDTITNMKFILYWNTIFQGMDFYYGLGQIPFQKCKYTNCFSTSNKNFLPVERFDAIIFYGPTYKINKDLYPLTRSLHQRYILSVFEPPVFWFLPLRRLRLFFNWTLTFRHDSDIPNPYGTIIKTKTNYKELSLKSLENKKGQIAWFVSNCKLSTSGRNVLASKLNSYVKIDVFGKCGNLSCSKENGKCFEMLENNYKFYLSFENSYCQDYVTEKLFKVLQYNVVPVVYGWVNYKKIAPPHSVINLEDFNSIENLADYLKYLDKNDEKYVEYFKWKTDYYSISSLRVGICNLCEKLNTDSNSKFYDKIIDWWTDGFQICRIRSTANTTFN